MNEEPYKNREIDAMAKSLNGAIDELKKDLTGQNDAARAETLAGFEAVNKRQDVANGRTTKLEKWQYTTLGGVSVLSIIVVPLLGWALYTLTDIQSQIHQAVDQALSAYNIQK